MISFGTIPSLPLPPPPAPQQCCAQKRTHFHPFRLQVTIVCGGSHLSFTDITGEFPTLLTSYAVWVQYWSQTFLCRQWSGVNLQAIFQQLFWNYLYTQKWHCSCWTVPKSMYSTDKLKWQDKTGQWINFSIKHDRLDRLRVGKYFKSLYT